MGDGSRYEKPVRMVEADIGNGRGEPRPYVRGDRLLGAVTAPMVLRWYSRRGLPACGVLHWVVGAGFPCPLCRSISAERCRAGEANMSEGWGAAPLQESVPTHSSIVFASLSRCG